MTTHDNGFTTAMRMGEDITVEASLGKMYDQGRAAGLIAGRAESGQAVSAQARAIKDLKEQRIDLFTRIDELTTALVTIGAMIDNAMPRVEVAENEDELNDDYYDPYWDDQIGSH